jgi:integrase
MPASTDKVADLLREYEPVVARQQWPRINAFVAAAVADCDGETPYPARLLLVAATQHALWCFASGIPLEREHVFRRDAIDAAVSNGFPNTSRASRATLRTRLLRMAEVLVPADAPHRLVALPAAPAQAPYSKRQLVDVYTWTRSQRTESANRDAAALLGLGLGAGLSAAEILSVRGKHLREGRQGLVLDVVGPRSREVPLFARWEPLLRDALGGAAMDEYLFRPLRVDEHWSRIANFAATSLVKTGRPTAQRLRATWIVTHLSIGTHSAVLMKTADVQSLEAFTRFMEYVTSPGTEECERLLRGRSSALGSRI